MFRTATKLSYIIDQYYELTGRQATSCDFNGNATLFKNAPTGTAALAAESSCLANPSATFVPVAPTTTGSSGGSNGGSGSNGSGGGSNTNQNNGGVTMMSGSRDAMFGALVAIAFSFAGGLLALQ